MRSILSTQEMVHYSIASIHAQGGQNHACYEYLQDILARTTVSIARLGESLMPPCRINDFRDFLEDSNSRLQGGIDLDRMM
jgi:hypothetical protein